MPPPLTYFPNKLEKSVISKLEDLALSNTPQQQIHPVAPPLTPKICTVHLGELDDEKCNRNNKQKNKSEPHNTKNFINSGGQQTDKTSSPYSLKIKRPRLAKQQNSPSPVKHPLLQYSYSSSNLHTPQPLPTLISRRASMISLKSKEEKNIPKTDFKMPKFTSTTEMLRQQQPDYQVSPFEESEIRAQGSIFPCRKYNNLEIFKNGFKLRKKYKSRLVLHFENVSPFSHSHSKEVK